MMQYARLVAIGFALFSTSATAIQVGAFSTWQVENGIQDGWQPITFENIDRESDYSLELADGITVLRAESDSAASMLAKKVNLDPQTYSVINWRWKIRNTVEAGDVREKSGDDYAARLYITFDYDRRQLGWFDRMKVEAFNMFYGEYPPLRAITYIWDNQSPKGLVVANAYTDNVVMFVVQSGSEHAGEWVSEHRNILDDYQTAFGELPPKINGIAIMTDTDNTQSSATAWYGDISLTENPINPPSPD